MIMRIRLRSLLTTCLLLAACGGDGPLSIREVREIQLARARWLAAPVRMAYRYEVRQSCFCPSEFTRWNTVTVVNDVVIDVRVTDTEAAVPAAQWGSYPTVERLFTSLNLENSDYLDDVTVRFDAQYGYPVEVVFVASPEIADGGGGYFARNLQPVGIR